MNNSIQSVSMQNQITFGNQTKTILRNSSRQYVQRTGLVQNIEGHRTRSSFSIKEMIAGIGGFFASLGAYLGFKKAEKTTKPEPIKATEQETVKAEEAAQIEALKEALVKFGYTEPQIEKMTVYQLIHAIKANSPATIESNEIIMRIKDDFEAGKININEAATRILDELDKMDLTCECKPNNGDQGIKQDLDDLIIEK